jgi:sRNA-binding regulator protein Hfq
VNLVSATIGGNLECDNGKFIDPNGYALNASGIDVKSGVYLRNGFNAEGEVSLVSATIGGDLDCEGGQFINPNDPNGYALNANRANIMSSVYLSEGFKAEGEVNLTSAKIGGNLECDNGKFIDPNALNAYSINIGGNIFLRNCFKAKGGVNLVGATIDGDLDCSKGQFINPNGDALVIVNSNIMGSVYMLNDFKAEGGVVLGGTTINRQFIWEDVNSPEKTTLNLKSATIGTLWDNPNSWPDKGRLLLHGLVYKEIYDNAPRDAERRIDWLRRQPDFRPQPYEQLAEVLRKSGQDDDAKKVLIAKNKDKVRRTRLTCSEIPWYHIFGPIIGFGYGPCRAFWIVILIILLGWLLFRAYHETFMKKTKEAEELSVKFHPLVYSFDVFVPLVDLHQAKYFMPKENNTSEESRSNKSKLTMKGKYLRYYLWFEIVAGWILTTLLLASLSGLIHT